jgi:hypothetical protein
MSGRRLSGAAVRDLLLVVQVAAIGLILGAMAARLPGGESVLAPLDRLTGQPRATMLGNSEHALPSVPSSAMTVGAPVSTSAHPLPPVFPFSGQPSSSRQLDLRLELAQMAVQQRYASPAVTRP